MRKRKVGFIAVGLVLVSSAIVIGQSEQASRIKAHGSLSTSANRYRVSITTSEGKVVFVQPPHTQFYYEAWSLYPTTTKTQQLIRSFYCQGEATLVMTQYGKRIMSMTVNKATVEVDELSK
jgi:type IV secretory pathway protease TraF